MIKTRHLIAIFVPAFLIAGIALFVRIAQYAPLATDPTDTETTGTLSIPIRDTDPTLGKAYAKHTIIIYEDLGCDGCKAQNALLNQLYQNHAKDVRIVYKGTPISNFLSPTKRAHEYAICAAEQGKFFTFKDLVFAQDTTIFSEDLLASLAKSANINQNKLSSCLSSTRPQTILDEINIQTISLNIQSVPAVFLDNKQINPPTTIDGWTALLNLQ